MSKIAVLFSGQGSQYTMMGKAFYEQYEAARNVIEAFNTVSLLEHTFEELCFTKDERIHETAYTQPLIVATCLSIFACLPHHIQEKSSVAGLSLGEYTALIASQRVSFEEGIPCVCERAKHMSRVNDGSMLAVLKPDIEAIEAFCTSYEERTGQCLTISNMNSPKQVVCGGTHEAIDALEAHLQTTRMRTTRLAVSGAFHTRLYTAANDAFASNLDALTFHESNHVMYSCVTAQPLTQETARSIMARQMISSMQFSRMIEQMISDGYTTFIEVGPSGILAKLVRAISKDVLAYSIETPEDLQKLEQIEYI